MSTTSTERFGVLVVGGSGVFGSRLCERLARHEGRFRVVVGGRDESKAEHARRTVRDIDPLSDGGFLKFDRNRPDIHAVRECGISLVADAAGPFQGSSYVLPSACISRGIHYVDLADGRNFVSDIVGLDEAAREAGVAVLSGASSTPALTAAAVDSLTSGWRAISRIETAISPGNRAPRGLSVVEAILSEAGGSTSVFEDGRWAQGTPFSSWVRKTIPGLGTRSVSLCPTPDLDVMAERYRPLAGAVFRAGMELGVLNLGLRMLARARSMGLIRDLVPLARPLRWAADRLTGLGTDRGAMHVEVSGTDREGRSVLASWSLVAEANDGPTIPVLAASAIIVGIAEGRIGFRGAAPAVGIVDLEDILREGGGLALNPWSSWIDMGKPPFERALGSRMSVLPATTRRLHSAEGILVMDGEATIDPAGNALGRLVSRVFGFPSSAGTVPCRVLLERTPQGERWVRFFGRQRMVSLMRHAGDGMVDETFAMVTTRLRIDTDAQGLSLVPVSARAWGLPLPGFMLPKVTAREWEAGDGVHAFMIEVGLPVIGRLVRYEGTLQVS